MNIIINGLIKFASLILLKIIIIALIMKLSYKNILMKNKVIIMMEIVRYILLMELLVMICILTHKDKFIQASLQPVFHLDLVMDSYHIDFPIS